MSVGVVSVTKTLANVAARSFTQTVQDLIQFASEIASSRALGQKYLIENLAVIEAGLRTWIISKHLESMRVEVWDPKTGKAVEVYEFHLSYKPLTGGEETIESHSGRLKEELGRLHTLRPGLLWRVIATTKPGRPEVEGWTTTAPHNADHLVRREAGTMTSSAACETKLVYFIEGSSNTCS